MPSKMKVRQFLFWNLIIVPNWLFAQTHADSIISKYIDFIGGDAKWKAVKTITITGTYNYGGIQFPFSSFAKAPNKYKYIVPSGNKYFAQGFDGTKGWKIDKFKNETSPTILNGAPARAMANESDVELLDPFIDYKKRGYLLEDAGVDTVDGVLCTSLKLTRPGEDTGFYDIKKTDGQLLKKQIRSKNVEMDGSIIDIYYSDYRPEEGTYIAHKSVVKVKDQTILVITIDKVAFNTEIPDKEFQP